MIRYTRFSKGSARVDVNGGNAHVYISHGSYPFFSDDQDHGGVVIEKADALDVSDCLRSFALSTPTAAHVVAGVQVEWTEE